MKSKYFREYFCSFSSKSYYFYILGVSHLKNTKHSVCLKVPSPFQNFTNFQKLWFAFYRTESQSEKCLAQNESNISVGVHVGSSLIKVKDTHLMNNNQPVAEILCWRLGWSMWSTRYRTAFPFFGTRVGPPGYQSRVCMRRDVFRNITFLSGAC